MPAIRSVKNQYGGINAHLHSLLQNEGGWSDFHARHITHIADTLKIQLRGRGYTVGIEESLQIKRLEGSVREPESDVLIYDAQPEARTQGAVVMQETLTIAELLAEGELSEKTFNSIVISNVKPTRSGRGEAVAWIELLSPSNKGGGEDARFYRSKRLEILAAGLVFVELDYLHETPPTFPTIAPYRLPGQHGFSDEGHPYHMVILDPREKRERGPAWVKSFDVDEAIPMLSIPLSGSDVLDFDFGVPYRKTFEEGFMGDLVDYSLLPVEFEHYNRHDQSRIAARMIAVLEAARRGKNLESDIVPVSRIELEAAMRQIEILAG